MARNEFVLEGRMTEAKSAGDRGAGRIYVAFAVGESAAEFYLPHEQYKEAAALVGQPVVVSGRLRVKGVAKQGKTGPYSVDVPEFLVQRVQPVAGDGAQPAGAGAKPAFGPR